MVPEDFQVISENGVGLYGKSWLPEIPPDAVVCVVHGLGEHCGRYEHFAEPFTSQNIGIFTLDLRSHGRSEGKRGAGTINSYLKDVQELVVTARREFNDTPLFLLGHGFGGLLIVHYLAKLISKEIAGAIFSAPWVSSTIQPRNFTRKIAALLNYIHPSAPLSGNIDPGALAQNPEVGRQYRRDPLVHDKISARLYCDIEHSSGAVLDKASQIDVPVLICHGTADTIIPCSTSHKLAQKIPGAVLKVWENARHEPHSDFNKDQVIEYYINWIKSRL